MYRICARHGSLTSIALRNLKQYCRLKSSAAQDAVHALSTGDKLHGYTVNKVVEVPELFLTAVSLNHDKTGAQHLHIARDDDNNTFSVAFRTTPLDSTGVPHILEHTTLCGSRKYPVRDPFFKMLTRSLATFMNAFTASDWTMYPFSSQNKKDFENLLSVYLDAAFFPQLRELDFCQEGWRLEHENPQDLASPLVFKGVVFNEMKGAFSSSPNLFAQASQNQLLPSHTYGVVSGGDPACIPDLTWKQLKEFHSSHYHPSNSRFFTYGNFPLDQHLQIIDSRCLQHFKTIDVNTAVPRETRWTQPREAHISCQPDPMTADPQKQTTVAVNFLLSDITDAKESFIMAIIGTLLVDSETSPFYQALLEANIGSDYSPTTGFHSSIRESTFSVGLQGIHPDDVEKVKAIVSDTFDKVIQNGFEQSRIDAILHSIELGIKHQTSNFGLGLSMTLTPFWNHDGDPMEALLINKRVEEFKQQLKDNPTLLQDKVREYFKNNPHHLTLTMAPDDLFEEKRLEEENKKLETIVNSLHEEDRDIIYKRGLDLLEKQMAQEDMSCLPTLKLWEIDKEIKPEPVDTVFADGIPIQLCEQPTNEVTYLRMVSNLSGIPSELLPYVPLFCNVITRMGAGGLDYKELSHQVELHTGGLSVDTHIVSHHSQPLGYEQAIVFSSHCLDKNIEKMLELWTEIFNSADLSDISRLTTLIRMTAVDLASSLSGIGHTYAMSHSASTLCPAARLNELFSGVTQVTHMKKLAVSDDQKSMVEPLIKIGKYLLNKENLRVSVNTTSDNRSRAVQLVEKFVSTVPGQNKALDTVTMLADYKASPGQTHFELPFSVNYMSKSIQTVPYTHTDYPRLKVLAKLLSTKFLHREIREKGGAYGGGASCSPNVFSFFSYRDPNSLQTLDVFHNAIEWAEESRFSDEDIDEAKLAVFQQTDKPVPPSNAGMRLFLSSITDEMRQVEREKLFKVERQDLEEVAKRYLTVDKKPSSMSFLGPTNKQVQEDEQWTVLKE